MVWVSLQDGFLDQTHPIDRDLQEVGVVMVTRDSHGENDMMVVLEAMAMPKVVMVMAVMMMIVIVMVMEMVIPALPHANTVP